MGKYLLLMFIYGNGHITQVQEISRYPNWDLCYKAKEQMVNKLRNVTSVIPVVFCQEMGSIHK